MIGTKVIIEHKYEIGEIFELKNENNDKSIFCKVIDITLDLNRNSPSTEDILKTFIFLNKCYFYRLCYSVETQ